VSSLYLDDFKVGQTFESTGRTITETDLTMFSMLSGDWNPIHADAEFSRATRYAQRLVHGALGIAISTGMLHQIGIFERSVIAMLGFREWNFLKPLLIGDTVHLHLEILSVEPGRSGRSGKLGRRFRLVNQRGEIAQEGESDVLVLTHEGARLQEVNERTSSTVNPTH